MNSIFTSTPLLWIGAVAGMLVSGCGGKHTDVAEEKKSSDQPAALSESSTTEMPCPPSGFQILQSVGWDEVNKAILVKQAPGNCHFSVFIEYSPESKGQSVLVNGAPAGTSISAYPLKTGDVSSITPLRSNEARYDAMVATQSEPDAARFEFTDSDGTITRITIRLEENAYPSQK